jgi:ABC-2 type transport system permease protein
MIADAATNRAHPGSTLRRIYAMLLRHLYILRGSLPRLLELAYWPTMQMIIWGFMSTFLATNSSWVAQAGGVLLAAVLLWDVLFRGQLGLSLSFMEEMWSRNLGHLFVSPLRPGELVASMMAMSFIRTLIGVGPAALLCILFYDYSVFSLGLPLIAFFANLIVLGWALGLLVVALLLRFGLGAENLAWFIGFMMAPISAVYYPVTTLPGWLQAVAWSLPATYVFEGMRAVLFEHRFRFDLLAGAVALNLLYLSISFALFMAAFQSARRRGTLLQVGE